MKLPEINNILQYIPGCKVIPDAPMSEYTSFKIGGPADFLVEPENIESLRQVLQILTEKDIPFFILGKGSNLLVGDGGIRGVVLKLSGLKKVTINHTKIVAESGITLAKLSAIAMAAQLTGLEFASGIPGTLGGAVVMNAGAYGGEMKDIITRISALTPSGEKKVLRVEEVDFGYRKSIFQKNGWIVVEVETELKMGNPHEIRALMNELNAKRKEKQPLEYPSAGSTFKRPPGYFAGSLIEQAGLKGYTIGGAQVSEKHAGFIVNIGGAKARDVLDLIKYVQERVREQVGVELEPEVRLIGDF